VEWGDHPAEALLSLADREKADVIVVGTHGRSGLSRLVMGSVAERLVRHSSVPVIPIRPGMQLRPPPEMRERA
jgi:nucleotide-binding universal stress UspA family protein